MLWDIQLLEPGEKLAQDSKTFEQMEGPNLIGLHERIDSLDTQIIGFLSNYSSKVHGYVEELHIQQQKFQDEIIVIHLKPIYFILYLIFGILLGYLIPLNKVALSVILIAIGFTWFYVTSFLESSFNFGNSHTHQFLITKICILLILNSILLVFAIKTFERSKEIDL